ncbi:MAG: DUF2834 domain-containing protein [Chloroflexota bacterium]
MSSRAIYLGLSIIGLVVPYTAFVPFLLERGLNASLILHQLFANRISTFFGLDVILSALVVVVLVSEHRQAIGRFRWLPLIGTFAVGVSFGLPLALYLMRRPGRLANAQGGS